MTENQSDLILSLNFGKILETEIPITCPPVTTPEPCPTVPATETCPTCSCDETTPPTEGSKHFHL